MSENYYTSQFGITHSLVYDVVGLHVRDVASFFVNKGPGKRFSCKKARNNHVSGAEFYD